MDEYQRGLAFALNQVMNGDTIWGRHNCGFLSGRNERSKESKEQNQSCKHGPPHFLLETKI
jgi:hypothetical protein